MTFTILYETRDYTDVATAVIIMATCAFCAWLFYRFASGR